MFPRRRHSVAASTPSGRTLTGPSGSPIIPLDLPLSPAPLVDVLGYCLRHPVEALVRRWNYKAALTSAGVRSVLFLVANATAGASAAALAAATEFSYRLVTAGFYGALTQHFGRVTPPRAGWLAAMVCLPLLGHGGELLVHWWRGTPNLGASLLASVTLTVLSTSFNLFAMRRGVLVVGVPGRPSLWADLRALPWLAVEFAVAGGRGAVRGLAAALTRDGTAARPTGRLQP